MNKYKEAYQSKMKSKILSGDLLRLMCYVSAGVCMVLFKWFIGFPIAIFLIFVGQFIESNIDKLKREIE